MQVGDRARNLPVHFLGPGMIDVPAAQPRLDMAHRDLAEIRRKRRRHRRERVAVDQDTIGLFAVEGIAETGDEPCEEGVERLIRGHHVEIDVGNDPTDFKNPVEHLSVLGGDADACLERDSGTERMHDRKHLDRFGACPEDGHYLHALVLQRRPRSMARAGAVPNARLIVKACNTLKVSERRPKRVLTAVMQRSPAKAVVVSRGEGG